MSSRHAEHHGESGSHRSRQRPFVGLNAGGTVVGVTGRKCFCAHSVDIYVDVGHVVVPRARTLHRKGAQNNRFWLRASEVRPAARAAEWP
jgi:hypothetical protein